MHLPAGVILVLVGTGCIAYTAAGAAVLDREPPFVALGVLLIAHGVGLWGTVARRKPPRARRTRRRAPRHRHSDPDELPRVRTAAHRR